MIAILTILSLLTSPSMASASNESLELMRILAEGLPSASLDNQIRSQIEKQLIEVWEVEAKRPPSVQNRKLKGQLLELVKTLGSPSVVERLIPEAIAERDYKGEKSVSSALAMTFARHDDLRSQYFDDLKKTLAVELKTPEQILRASTILNLLIAFGLRSESEAQVINDFLISNQEEFVRSALPLLSTQFADSEFVLASNLKILEQPTYRHPAVFYMGSAADKMRPWPVNTSSPRNSLLTQALQKLLKEQLLDSENLEINDVRISYLRHLVRALLVQRDPSSIPFLNQFFSSRYARNEKVKWEVENVLFMLMGGFVPSGAYLGDPPKAIWSKNLKVLLRLQTAKMSGWCSRFLNQ